MCMEPMGAGTQRTKVTGSFSCSHGFCFSCDRELAQRRISCCPMCREPRVGGLPPDAAADTWNAWDARMPRMSSYGVGAAPQGVGMMGVLQRAEPVTVFFPVVAAVDAGGATDRSVLGTVRQARVMAAVHLGGYPNDTIPGTEAELDDIGALPALESGLALDGYGIPTTTSGPGPVRMDHCIHSALMGLLNVDRFNLRDFVSATRRERVQRGTGTLRRRSQLGPTDGR